MWLAVGVALGSLAAMVTMVVLILQNRRHRQQLQRLAEIDDLTGLPNRRHVVQIAQQQIEAARRNGAALTIGLVDEAAILYQRGEIAEAQKLLGLATQLREMTAQLLVTHP